MTPLPQAEVIDTQLRRVYDGRLSETEREADLESLLTSVRPLIRQRIRQGGISGEDLEDLTAESIRRLLVALRRGCEEEGARIADVLGYARRVAQHVQIDHIQRGRTWRQWKRRVVELLDGRWGGDLFARWVIRTAWTGGFARWKGHPFCATSRYRDFCEEPDRFCHDALKGRDPSHFPLPDLLAHLFGWLGTPLELDDLTKRVCGLLRVSDISTVSIDDLAADAERDPDELLPRAADDVEQAAVSAIASQTLRPQLWDEIQALPSRQRAALLLAMDRDQLMLLAERAGAVAAALEMPIADFGTLWPRLPLSDPVIGARLEATQQQVSNLRKCARERIGRWLARNEAC